MENILINDNENIQQKDIYKMIEALNKKYNILEQKLKEKDETLIKDKKIMLIMNKNMISIQNQFSEFKKNCEKDINDLREKIEKKNRKERYDEINYIDNDNELLNKIKSEFDKKKKDIDEQLKKLTDEIKEIKTSLINKEELKIVENKDTDVLESFGNLLAIIISQRNIDSNNFKKLEEIVEKLKNKKLNPNNIVNNYFSENFKYLQNKKEKDERDEKDKIELAKLQSILNKAIDEIENELIRKKKSSNEQKKQDTKSESFLGGFFKNFYN